MIKKKVISLFKTINNMNNNHAYFLQVNQSKLLTQRQWKKIEFGKFV